MARSFLCKGSKALQNYSDFDKETAHDALIAAGVTAVIPGAQEVAGASLATATAFDAVSTVEGLGSSFLSGLATGNFGQLAAQAPAAGMTLGLPGAVGGAQMEVGVDAMKAGADMAADKLIDATTTNGCE